MCPSKKKASSVSMSELMQQVETKKQETKALQSQMQAVAQANQEVAQANNTEVAIDPALSVAQGDKMLSMLGYIHFLCILPLILRQESEFCQFHGKQGLVITLLFMGIGIVAKFFSYYWVATNLIFYVIWFALALYGIVQAYKGQMKKIPGIGDLAKLLNWNEGK